VTVRIARGVFLKELTPMCFFLESLPV